MTSPLHTFSAFRAVSKVTFAHFQKDTFSNTTLFLRQQEVDAREERFPGAFALGMFFYLLCTSFYITFRLRKLFPASQASHATASSAPRPRARCRTGPHHLCALYVGLVLHNAVNMLSQQVSMPFVSGSAISWACPCRTGAFNH